MQIDRYQIEDEVARGGMGVVYRARDPSLDRVVALKVMTGAGSPDELVRFKAEQEAVARLRHPHVVPIHDAGLHKGRPFLVMDFVEGESLKARLRRDGPLDLDEAARIARTLADALDHAHQNQVLHRDLKPDNVLLGAQGQVHLTDFGLARLGDRDTRITLSGEVMGTPVYMPPEQANGERERIGPRSDVYGVGATLYEMLTGEPPYRGHSLVEILNAVLTRSPRAPSELRPSLDPALEALCLRCLARAPEDRFPSAAELRVALDGWLGGERSGSRPSPAPVGAVPLALAGLGGRSAAPTPEPVAKTAPVARPQGKTEAKTAAAPSPPSAPRRLVIQPGPLFGKDTYVRNDYLRGQDNHGGDTSLVVGDRPTPARAGTDFRAYLAFALDELPPGAQVQAATLSVFLWYVDFVDRDLVLVASEVASPWSEGNSGSKQRARGMTWARQPTVAPRQIGRTLIRAQHRGWVELTVTAAVRRWAADRSSNHGLRLSHEPPDAPYEDGAKYFWSSDGARPELRPKLTVTYRGKPPRPGRDEKAAEVAARRAADELIAFPGVVAKEVALQRATQATARAPFYGKAWFLRGRAMAQYLRQRGRRDVGDAHGHMVRADAAAMPWRAREVYAWRFELGVGVPDLGWAVRDLAELKRRWPDDPKIPHYEQQLAKLKRRLGQQ